VYSRRVRRPTCKRAICCSIFSSSWCVFSPLHVAAVAIAVARQACFHHGQRSSVPAIPALHQARWCNFVPLGILLNGYSYLPPDFSTALLGACMKPEKECFHQIQERGRMTHLTHGCCFSQLRARRPRPHNSIDRAMKCGLASHYSLRLHHDHENRPGVPRQTTPWPPPFGRAHSACVRHPRWTHSRFRADANAL